MNETSQLGLPLVQPAQAQKHVTVNEALVRLDGLTHLTLGSRSETTPPSGAADGDTYAVPALAVDEWSLNVGDIAIFSNGGWVFVTPKKGWQGFVVDEDCPVLYNGSDWALTALAVTPSGASSDIKAVEFDHVISAGATSTTVIEIPKYAVVFAVTGRIKTAITGAVSNFDLGVSGSSNRYGGGLGLAQGSWMMGVTGQPVTYYSDTPLIFTANGGNFAAGEVRLVLHYYIATVPSI